MVKTSSGDRSTLAAKSPRRCCRGGEGESYFIPRSLPSFLCRPALVVGIPVAFEIFLFVFVIPSARFQLKDRPGILLFAIWCTTFWFYIFDCTKCNNRHIAPLQKYLEGHNYGRANEKSSRTFCQPDARAEKCYSCDG